MDELTDAQVARLSHAVNEGHIIRSWCQHQGYKIYEKALQEKISDKKNVWLKGSDEEAKTARIRAQGIQEALDELKKFMLQGDTAAHVLNQTSAPISEK